VSRLGKLIEEQELQVHPSAGGSLLGRSYKFS
jgi:hypothetical protein